MKGIFFLFPLLLPWMPSIGQENKPDIYVLDHFVKGSVLMKTGATEYAFMNYNAEDQSIVFEQGNKVLTLTGLEGIDTIYLEKKRYIPGADDKIYEVVANAPVASLVLYYTGKLVPHTAVANKDGTKHETTSESSNTMSSIYVLRPYKGDYVVELQKNYRLLKHRQLIKASSAKDFEKAFPHHENEIKAFINDHQLKLSTEADLLQLANYCNTLSS